MCKDYHIAVFGSSAADKDSVEARTAYRLGRLLAEAGYAVLTGGYGGAMAAVCRGAHEAGGETTGVVSATLFPDREPNPYLTERVEAPDLLGRIEGLFRRAHAFVVLDGSVGTVTELLLAWNHRLLGDPRPLVLVGPRLRQLAGNLCASSGIGENELALLDFVPTPEEAVAVLDHRLG